MSVTGADIVTAARSWIGTPYQHQAACKGAGSDCLGLICGVWTELLGALPEHLPAYSMDWSEPQGEERLWQAALRQLKPKTLQDAGLGDVILFRMRTGSVAKHLGVQSACGRQSQFIHAYSRCGVIESPLSTPWRRRIVARFEFPMEVR